MRTNTRWTKSTLIFGGAAIWGLLLVSCVMVDRTVVAPPQVAGATYVGSKECAQCHEEAASHFLSSSHARLNLKDAKKGDIGCEGCHGGGSVHVKAGGGKGTIINPGKSPETCFKCHLDKRGEFSLPNAHPVMEGKITCGDCHEPHSGRAVKGSGAAIEAQNETCLKCHLAQKGPWVFKHNAMVEGCTACHNPHGSVNQKMLVARDANLCLRCHVEHPSNLTVNGAPGTLGNGTIVAGGEDHRSRLNNGNCWTQGCHETIHGSNVSKPLRY